VENTNSTSASEDNGAAGAKTSGIRFVRAAILSRCARVYARSIAPGFPNNTDFIICFCSCNSKNHFLSGVPQNVRSVPVGEIVARFAVGGISVPVCLPGTPVKEKDPGAAK
jgi:hypothetical protein